MKTLLFALCFFLNVASADQEIVIPQGDKGQITLRIIGKRLIAHPEPNPSYFSNPFTRPKRVQKSVPLYRNVHLGESGEHVFAPLRPLELFSVGNRHFVVVRERGRDADENKYLMELRVGFGRKIGFLHYAVPAGFAAITPLIALNPDPVLIPYKAIAIGGFLVAAGVGAATIYRASLDASGSAHFVLLNGSLMKVANVERSGSHVTDVLIAQNLPDDVEAIRLTRLVRENECPIFLSGPTAAKK